MVEIINVMQKKNFLNKQRVKFTILIVRMFYQNLFTLAFHKITVQSMGFEAIKDALKFSLDQYMTSSDSSAVKPLSFLLTNCF